MNGLDDSFEIYGVDLAATAGKCIFGVAISHYVRPSNLIRDELELPYILPLPFA